MLPQHTNFHSLPSEVVLDVFSRVEYSPELSHNLRCVDRRFNQISTSYEHCIAGIILDTQFSWARRQFPGVLQRSKESGQKEGWRELAALYRRTAVLSNIKARCKVIRESGSEHSAWTTCRALTFHHTGLLLLYRLADCGSQEARVALLSSLPQSSLAVLLFTLLVSVHLLRAIGPQMTLIWNNPPVTEEARSDIELAIEELLLRNGPPFLLGLLMHEKDSILLLKHEVDTMDERQTHFEDGSPPPPTLIATLRQTFSLAMGCEMRYNLVHMWYCLDEQCADLADPREHVVRDAMERIVNGEVLENRCCRCRAVLYGL